MVLGQIMNEARHGFGLGWLQIPYGDRGRGRQNQHRHDPREDRSGRNASAFGWRRRRGLERALHREPHIAHVASSPLRVLGNAQSQHLAKRSWSLSRQCFPFRLLRQHVREGVRHILARKRTLAREHLIQNDTERPNIRTFIDLLALRLFGAHIRRGPEDHSDPRRVSGESRRHRAIGVGSFFDEGLGKAEVENYDFAVLGELDVGRFQISMNNSLLVRFLQCFGDLVGDFNSLVYKNRCS